jgi:hypothetical protein
MYGTIIGIVLTIILCALLFLTLPYYVLVTPLVARRRRMVIIGPGAVQQKPADHTSTTSQVP